MLKEDILNLKPFENLVPKSIAGEKSFFIIDTTTYPDTTDRLLVTLAETIACHINAIKMNQAHHVLGILYFTEKAPSILAKRMTAILEAHGFTDAYLMHSAIKFVKPTSKNPADIVAQTKEYFLQTRINGTFNIAVYNDILSERDEELYYCIKDFHEKTGVHAIMTYKGE